MRDTRSERRRSALYLFAFLPSLLLLGAGVLPQEIVPLPPVAEANGRLGTCYAFYDDQRSEQAHAAGSRWDRFDFRWNAIDLYGYGGHDAIVARYAASETPLEIIGILGAVPERFADCTAVMQAPRERGNLPLSTPTFLTAGADDPGWFACPPANLDLPWNHPENHWAQFVHETVTRYAGQVDTWEIWNEPDLAYFWQGTPEQYAHLLQVSYRAVKDANPDATVLFGGLAYWGNPSFYLDVLDALAADPESAAHNGYFDVMSLHLYADVRLIYDISRDVQNEVTARVGPHPLWLTEAGVRIWDEDERPPDWPGEWPPYYSATGEEAAAYVIEAYASARAAGVERFLVFRLHDDGGGMPGERYGLTRDDYSLRPAYLAYQVAAGYLRGENQVTGPFGSSVKRITFWGTPHGRIDVLWNQTPDPLTYRHPALLPTATLVDREGARRTLTAGDGTFTLDLPPATSNNHPEGRYLIGGPPLLLVQADTQAPASALDPLPPFTAAQELTVTWTASDSESGVWYEELQRAPSPTGPWTTVAGWEETTGVTATRVSLLGSGDWYFRGRARDRVGNWEPWPEGAEISTTARLTRTVALSTSVFSDLNGDGLRAPGEPLLPGTTIRWKDAEGMVVTESVGSAWTLTRTVDAGNYTLSYRHPDHLFSRHPFTVTLGEGIQSITRSQGLRPVVARIYLPITLR
ncbi:MAG: hypothetical protein ACLFU8_07365 [Anaerolineales bacterium]